MSVLPVILASVLILGAAWLFFARISREYRTGAKLNPLSSLLEVLIFALLGCGSYAFLDFDLAHINSMSPLFGLAAVFINISLAAMTKLGYRQPVGCRVKGLQVSGFYRYTRNRGLQPVGDRLRPAVAVMERLIMGAALRGYCPPDGAYRGSQPGTELWRGL